MLSRTLPCCVLASIALAHALVLLVVGQAGHALVGALMPEYDPVQKISIVPRGAAGGLTFFAPSEERLESGLYSKSYLENQVPSQFHPHLLFTAGAMFIERRRMSASVHRQNFYWVPWLVQMAVALGGRVAEELIFGEDSVTTGASSDFQQASSFCLKACHYFFCS